MTKLPKSAVEDSPRFDSIEEAITDLREGRMIVLVDDEDRENEGDLVCAAEKVTPEIINFMAGKGRGLICLALHPTIVDRLELPLMVETSGLAGGGAPECGGGGFHRERGASPRF